MNEENLNDNLSLDDLVIAFQKFLDKKVLEKPIQTKITKKEYSIEERNKEIKKLIRQKKRVSFNELFTFYNKSYIVVTFLSVLDLVRKGQLDIEQSGNFDEIYVIDSEG